MYTTRDSPVYVSPRSGKYTCPCRRNLTKCGSIILSFSFASLVETRNPRSPRLASRSKSSMQSCDTRSTRAPALRSMETTRTGHLSSETSRGGGESVLTVAPFSIKCPITSSRLTDVSIVGLSAAQAHCSGLATLRRLSTCPLISAPASVRICTDVNCSDSAAMDKAARPANRPPTTFASTSARYDRRSLIVALLPTSLATCRAV